MGLTCWSGCGARDGSAPITCSLSRLRCILLPNPAPAPFRLWQRTMNLLSLLAWNVSFATSECTSCDDRAQEKLFDMVTGTRASPKHQLVRFLSGGQLLSLRTSKTSNLAHWRKSFYVLSMSTYSTIMGVKACSYTMMAQVEETLVGYLSCIFICNTVKKKTTLPTQPFRTTSTLLGKAFQAAGQAGAAHHGDVTNIPGWPKGHECGWFDWWRIILWASSSHRFVSRHNWTDGHAFSPKDSCSPWREISVVESNGH